MHLFCINLDRSPHRLEYMRSQAKRVGLELERIRAVDGANVPEWLANQFQGSPLIAGEIGCYASHLIAARQLVDRALPYAVICEDDAPLATDFATVVRSAVAAAPANWDIIHLTEYNSRTLVQIADLDGDHSLVRYTRLPKNTNAYLLSNAGARKWLCPTPRTRPSDVDVRYAWQFDFNILGVYPAIAFRGTKFGSDIDRTKSGRRRTRQRKWSPSVVSRLRGAIWQMRKTGFANMTVGLAVNAWRIAFGRFLPQGPKPIVICRATESAS